MRVNVRIAPQATGRLLLLCARLVGVSQHDLLRALLQPELERLYNRARKLTNGELPPLDELKLMDADAFQRLAREPVRRRYRKRDAAPGVNLGP